MFEEVIEVNGVQFGPCPFCGEFPDVEHDGSCVDVSCCCSMSFQKCDYLTIEQRETWNDKTYRYSDEAENIVLDEAARMWNKRFEYKY